MRVQVCRATLGPSQETLKYHKANRGYCINRLSRLLTEGTTGVKHPAKPVTGKSDAYALESLERRAKATGTRGGDVSGRTIAQTLNRANQQKVL